MGFAVCWLGKLHGNSFAVMAHYAPVFLTYANEIANRRAHSRSKRKTSHRNINDLAGKIFTVLQGKADSRHQWEPGMTAQDCFPRNAIIGIIVDVVQK